jgi:trehalose-phosphatase
MEYLLFLDYDGTLTPIVKKPRLAVLSRKYKAALREIARTPHILTAVISGRMLSDLKHKVSLPGIYYAGNHGFEIEGPRFKITHPRALAAKPLLRRIKHELLKRLKAVPGIIIEDKVLTLSLHYRLVKRQDLKRIKQVFQKIVRPYLKTKRVRITRGKKVFEVRPNIAWDKGRAVLWFMEKLAKGKDLMPVYIGDDKTDEDAFRALKKKGITVRVGRSNKTQAKYFVRNVNGVYRFLEMIRCSGDLFIPREVEG